MNALAFDAPPRQRAGVKPLIRWVGGKSWLVGTLAEGIHRRLLSAGGRYLEPFLGGGAMALNLGARRAVIGDVEPELMAFYEALKNGPAQLVREVAELREEYGTSRAGYYVVRALPDTRPDTPVAARFLYLNKLCFNGLHRVNKRGQFNVPYGDTKPRWPTVEQLRAAAAALRGARLVTGDFGKVLRTARANDVIFADSPYHGTWGSYAAGGFSERDQARLAVALRRASERGAWFVATNSDTPHVRAWYDWATIVPTKERRAVNSDGGGRGRVQCLLITNDLSLINT